MGWGRKAALAVHKDLAIEKKLSIAVHKR
jgi:hypothetical protein